MKHLTMVLAAVMAFSVAVPAFAAAACPPQAQKSAWPPDNQGGTWAKWNADHPEPPGG